MKDYGMSESKDTYKSETHDMLEEAKEAAMEEGKPQHFIDIIQALIDECEEEYDAGKDESEDKMMDAEEEHEDEAEDRKLFNKMMAEK